MNLICADSVLRDLLELEEDSRLTPPTGAKMQIFKMEPRFLKICIWGLAKWSDALFGKNKHMGSVRKSHRYAREFGDWNILVSNLLERIQNCNPEVKESSPDMLNSPLRCDREATRLCLRILRASKPSPSENFKVCELVFNLVVFLLKNLVNLMKGSVGILQSWLFFFMKYRLYQSKTKKPAEGYELLDYKSSSTVVLVQAETDVVLSGASDFICSVCAKEFNKGIAKEWNIQLQKFIEKINIVKAEVRKIHASILGTSSFCFPCTNVVGFMDLLLENLNKILESEFQAGPFAKHEIEIVQEELFSFEDFFEQQNEHEQPKDIWTEIVNVPYLVDLAIKSYVVLCLSDVTEEMKFIRGDFKKIEYQQLYKFGELKPTEVNSSPMFPAQAIKLRIDDILGLKEDANTIIEIITRESKPLEIVSFFGMPGVGKTTLANKVYNDPLFFGMLGVRKTTLANKACNELLIQYCFHKRTWCFIS